MFFFAFLQDFSLIISKSLESNDLLKENSSNGASHPERIFFFKSLSFFFTFFDFFRAHGGAGAVSLCSSVAIY